MFALSAMECKLQAYPFVKGGAGREIMPGQAMPE
jgi:hypothetical protein